MACECDCCATEYALCYLNGDWACECCCRPCVERVKRGAFTSGWDRGRALLRAQIVGDMEKVPIYPEEGRVELLMVWVKNACLGIARGSKPRGGNP
jgi:hypothetical protein